MARQMVVRGRAVFIQHLVNRSVENTQLSLYLLLELDCPTLNVTRMFNRLY